MRLRRTPPPGPDPAGEFPPGHYYSPIPSLDDVRARAGDIFRVPDELPGIDLRAAEQLALVDRLAPYAASQPFAEEASADRRYHFGNRFFGHGDAIVLHALLRHLRPARFVEIGSGFSSAVALDTNDLFLDGAMRCTFVEPYAERLRALLRSGDDARHEVVEQPVQGVDLALFDTLGPGDVLFVDSTHVSKVGSDVNRIVFEVLPRLAPGVVVHVHDVMYPFEYPPDWVLGGRAWNEAYLLRAFLMFNGAFRILLWNSYLGHAHREAVAARLPLWERNSGGSIWLERA